MKQTELNVKNQMTQEMKKVLGRLKVVQSKFETAIKDQVWMDEARRYAEKQGKEVKKMITADAAKLKSFLERERKDLEKFQRQLPAEVKKVKGFVEAQRKEVEKLIATVTRQGAPVKAKTKAKKAASKAKPKAKKVAKKAASAAAN
jgi:hypothetical protein